jgi:23S rRNA (cytosine1962-C5)-methyltransferase
MELDLPLIADGEDKSSIIKNRIRKNYRHVRKWAKRTSTNAFRIYDRDIKEYPLAIDFYDGRFCVQYFSYNRDEDDPSEELKNEIDQAIISIFSVGADQIFWRNRIRREKLEQYEKLGSQSAYFTVYEYGIAFKVNLKDYLDTGLFLDHRETRQLVAKLCKGKRLLNLFSYTCSFSVQAAAHGSLSTTSVDMSNTYTQWGGDNFALNHLSPAHNIIYREDCLKFLELAATTRLEFDVIVIDPPTISRSKKMDNMFDVQKDYPYLIKQALKLLAPEGTIIFSNNFRKFKFDEQLFADLKIEEITHKTIPLDFHNQKIHRCWRLERS